MSDENPEEFDRLLDEVMIEATAMAAYGEYLAANTARERVKVVTDALGLPLEQTVVNLTHNATENSVRYVLAAVINGLWEEGMDDMAMMAMEKIASMDYAAKTGGEI